LAFSLLDPESSCNPHRMPWRWLCWPK